MSTTLNDCGCCAPAKELERQGNAPGLSEVAYRVATRSGFQRAMLDGLSRQGGLRTLTTRDESDFSISLAEAWATALDVLTFYQERIANEAWLRTATERRSILELARTVGYELKPGVAASTYLCFVTESAAGAPASVRLDKGTRVQSIPAQDEKPQVLETVEELEARPGWNERKPVLDTLRAPTAGDTSAWFRGTGLTLRAGDALLLLRGERWDYRRVRQVEEDFDAQRTRVHWGVGLGSAPGGKLASAGVGFAAFVFRQRAAIFGHNASDWTALPLTTRTDYWGSTAPPGGLGSEWPFLSILAPSFPPQKVPGPVGSNLRTDWVRDNDTIDLDIVYSNVTAQSWLLLATPGASAVFRVLSVVEGSRAEYGLSGKTTRLELDTNTAETSSQFLKDAVSAVRHMAVFLQPEELTLAESPDPALAVVKGTSVLVKGSLDAPPAGRMAALTGKLAGTETLHSEVVPVESVQPQGAHTLLVLKPALQQQYDAATVTICLNVALATHGESQTQMLGSGSAAKANQEFTLNGAPLTFVTAETTTGAASTLEVRVDGQLWTEASTLLWAGAGDKVYVTQRDDAGKTTVRFGDGVRGARLPSGDNNVRAAYRVGLGLDGEVDAGQLTMLLSRPLGLKSATNPLAPSGAENAETRDQARENAPLTVLTLDRIVSLRDYEDFARAFAGIGKARADLLWRGESQVVYLTLATVSGAPLQEGSATHKSLLNAIRDASEGLVEPLVGGFQLREFDVDAEILVDEPLFERDPVKAAVAAALESAFSFAARAFAHPVNESEVIAAMQAVEGVRAVRLKKLAVTGFAHQPTLFALPARWENGAIVPGQLLLIREAGITLGDMTI